MDWFKAHWWLILIIIIGILINGIKALSRLDHRRYLANKPTLPPHRDNNAKWDDDEIDNKQDDKKD